MPRLTAKDFSPELLELYDGYVHGRISRRQFLDRASLLAVGGMTAVGILATLSPNYALAQQVALFVSRLRSQPFADAFQRAPGIAESVEWAKALVALDTLVVDPEVVSDTAGILFKQREDVAALTAALASELLQPEPEAS